MNQLPQVIPEDFHVKYTDAVLISGSVQFGRSSVTYTVERFYDLRNQKSRLAYLVTMTQRVHIPPKNTYVVGAGTTTSYDEYPALLINTVTPTVNNNASITPKSIFPRTLNSSVNTSNSSDADEGNSQSYQSSSGSSTTNVNSFGVGAGEGISTGANVGLAHMSVHTNRNAHVNYQRSYSNQQSRSNSLAHGQDMSSSLATSAGDSMSIKDWASYGYIDSSEVNPTWIFGQAYPWDVVVYNQTDEIPTDGSTPTIELPAFVQSRLISKNTIGGTATYQAMPPSELALFGIDFSMTCSWLLEYPDGVTSNETIEFDHVVSLYTASHQVPDASTPSVLAQLQTGQQASVASFNSGTSIKKTVTNNIPSYSNQEGTVSIDLSTYALLPLNGTGRGNGTTIGFTTAPFTYAPKAETDQFKVISPGNTMQVTGSGFTPGLTTVFSQMNDDPSVKPALTITFKVDDVTAEYTLVLMHWKGDDSGDIQVFWNVNGKANGHIYAEAKKGESVDGNLSTIELRNNNFSDINFHDYLKIGLNQITLQINAPSQTNPPQYTLFAATIGIA